MRRGLGSIGLDLHTKAALSTQMSKYLKIKGVLRQLVSTTPLRGKKKRKIKVAHPRVQTERKEGKKNGNLQ